MRTIVVLSNADTDLLALRSVIEGLPPGFPRVVARNPANLTTPSVTSSAERTQVERTFTERASADRTFTERASAERTFVESAWAELEDAGAVLVRLLGGRRSWEEGFDQLRSRCTTLGVPLVACGGEAVPDDELTRLSSAPAEVVARCFAYLTHGGLANVEQMLRYLGNTLLGTSFDVVDPKEVPSAGLLGEAEIDPGLPTVAIVFYRAHLLSGNTQFVDDLASAIRARGANAVPLYCYSLRPDESGRIVALDMLRELHPHCVVTTVLAMGSASGDQWDVSALAELDVPVMQAIASTDSRHAWESSSAGLSPLDVSMAIAMPEFDGRIVSVPVSFKEVVDDGDELGAPISAYRTVADRVERVAGLATRLARLRGLEPSRRRVAIVLSAYPTKKSRIGNAVALDTPASVIELVRAMRGRGYTVDRIPTGGDELMAELADGLGEDLRAPAIGLRRDDHHDRPAGGHGGGLRRLSIGEYRRWFDTLPSALRSSVVEAWGDPPGSFGITEAGEEFTFGGIDLGSVFVAVQPPRGFGDNPIAVYHSPDLAPTHHYLAFYRWLDLSFEADAIVHVGKHGTLEWLPGKGAGLSSACAPDAALGDIPLVYPFVVNDPGEAVQAKRRAHAVIVDHLLPPMTRAETYDDLARLESLLDEHARCAALDPDKLPAIRSQVWDLLVDAQIHRDLGVGEIPKGDDFDDLVLEVDGYLCELKDAQIRGGLHILGSAPGGEAELDLVLAMTRISQGSVPPLGLAPGIARSDLARAEVDDLELRNKQALADLQRGDWQYHGDDPTLWWVCNRLIPALQRTPDEIENVLRALEGRFVSPGPAGAPTRGMAHVLPTGRNLYSVDPKAVPSPLAWEVGCKLADSLVERHLREEGRVPRSVGVVVWGTATMRTMGDDVAEALALVGVRPRWQEESGRVVGLELIPESELERPRIDVTLRVSGFFRDAFPHVIALLDEAFAMAGFDDDPRIFGSKPGAYGSGILALLESRRWESNEDLAAVYETWSAWSYSRSAMGAPARDAMRRRFSTIEIAVKNQDNREHDIFDSDDYLQDHGGMVATIRALSGEMPKAFFGDSSDPARPVVRSLAEEAARVVRTRVLNPKWISAMQRHGYKGAFEMAATVDYIFGYDATAHIVEDWMYEKVTEAYVADPEVRKFFEASNPWALRSIAERLLEAQSRGLWNASDSAVDSLRQALLEAEGWEESR